MSIIIKTGPNEKKMYITILDNSAYDFHTYRLSNFGSVLMWSLLYGMSKKSLPILYSNLL